MQKLLKRKTNNIKRYKSHRLFSVMNLVLLEQVRMYSFYTAVNFGLPCAQTELNHKDCHSLSGVELLRLIYVQGKAISTPLKLGLFLDDSNNISPYSFSVHYCVLQ